MSIDSKRYSLRRFIKISRLRLLAMLLTGLVLIALGLFAWVGAPGSENYRVRMTGGNAALNRHKVAEYLKRHSTELNLDVEIYPTEGTPEAVRLVEAGEIDLALVNGLFRFPKVDAVRQVATLTRESVHLLVKREFAKQVSANFGNLEGLSVNIGPDNTESALLAKTLLKFLGLKHSQPSGGDEVRLTHFGIDDLLTRLDDIASSTGQETAALRSDLPDAVFHESTVPSELADRLVRVGQYELIPLPFSRAFAQISVDEEDLDRDHIDQIHVHSSVIPAYSYGATPPMPATDCPTLGTPLIVIAHKDVPDEVVARLLPKIYGGSVGRLYQPPSLEELSPTYPLHSASIAFRDRDRPIVRSEVVDLIRQILGGIAPLLGGCLALYGYYRWRQMLRFLEYFRRLQEVDLLAKGMMTSDEIPPPGPERVHYLESELEALQQKAVDDFCRNYFYGEGVLENFLSLLAESRDFLRQTDSPSLSQSDSPPT